MSEPLVLTRTDGRVGIAQLNRPKALNALNLALMSELMAALEAFDRDDAIGCMLILGTPKAFAAGADIKEMANASVIDMLNSSFIDQWDRLATITKPVIAGVSGYALGGGCELAMACDMIVASTTARFGQPEINLGVIPGAGGTQRLTHAVGKALAMEMVLNNRHLTAEEAERYGLVNRVFSAETFEEDALAFSAEIADRAPIALRLAKEAINAAYAMPLASGLAYERRLFYALFATDDQREGMDAFVNKRPANWTGK